MNKNVKIDSLVIVHIPKGYMQDLQWSTSDLLNVESDGDKLVLFKEELLNKCTTCGKLFTNKFKYCPFDGTILTKREEV